MLQFILRGLDGTDETAPLRRKMARPAHLENLIPLKKSENYILGGALLNDDGNMIGSVLILQFKSHSDLDIYLKTEPYVVHNVWEKIEISPFKVAQIKID